MRPLFVALALTLLGGEVFAAQEAVEQPVLIYAERPLPAHGDYDAGDLFVRVHNYAEANFASFGRGQSFTNRFGSPPTSHLFASFRDVESLLEFERQASRDEGWTALLGQVDAKVGVEGLRRYLFLLGGADAVPERGYRWMQVTRASQPDVPLARRLARDLVEYLDEHYEQINARVYTADLHDPGALFWFVDYKNLAAWRAVQAALVSDEGYLELAAAGRELFLPEEPNEALLFDCRLDPELARPFMRGLFLKDQGERAAAISALKEAAELEPRDPVVYRDLGWLLTRANDLEGAAASFDRWIQLRPSSGQAHTERAWIHMLQGDLDGARAEYERSFDVEPRYADAFGDLAWVLVTCPEEQRRIEEADELSRRALELAPRDATCNGARGAVLYRMGQLDASIETLARARELGDTEEPSVVFFRALAHHGRGEAEEARRWYALGLDLIDPEAPLRYDTITMRAEVEAALGITDPLGQSR
jgi:tetratricopeptide (TPR) repeat protein